MRRRATTILILAIVAGGVAGYSALQLLSNRATPLAAAGRPQGTEVVVAARDVQVGEILGEEDVKVVGWPGEVPLGYARTPSEVIGRGAITPILTNEPLLESKLGDRAGGGGLPIVIPEGMRAISVQVDEVSAVAGFVTPGTRVDVLLTTTDASGEPFTRVVMQNVQTLAAGQQIHRDAEGRPMSVGVLTVLVTPEDAERLALASQQGRIQLALRNMLDVRDTRTIGARMSRMFGGGGEAPPRVAQRPAPPPAEEPGQTIEVYKGGVRALISF